MPDIDRSKTCSKCGEEKKLTQFYKRKESRDGRYAACIKCENIRIQETFKLGTPEEIEARTAARIIANRKYLEKNPDKKQQYQRARKTNSKNILHRLDVLEQRLTALEAKNEMDT